jgi:hypothetical protein
MKIPNAENAIVDIRKLRDYSLNPTHPDGKHKARLFSSIFGMTEKDAPALREILLQVVTTEDAVLGRQDYYGQRYILDFTLNWFGKRGQVRSAWIIEVESDVPKLTTCYPL